MTIERYSVLMSVCYKENVVQLRCAMDSIWLQTVPADDFVQAYDDATPNMVVDTSLGILEGVKTGNG